MQRKPLSKAKAEIWTQNFHHILNKCEILGSRVEFKQHQNGLTSLNIKYTRVIYWISIHEMHTIIICKLP